MGFRHLPSFSSTFSAAQNSSLNSLIPSEEFSLKYSSIDLAIQAITSIGAGAWLSKTDISDAFKLLPIEPPVDLNILREVFNNLSVLISKKRGRSSTAHHLLGHHSRHTRHAGQPASRQIVHTFTITQGCSSNLCLACLTLP